MKKPATQPRTCTGMRIQATFSQMPMRRFGQSAPTKVIEEQKPNSISPHEPSDIGDQYLNENDSQNKLQPALDVGKPSANASFITSDLNSMCQNRSGRSRSIIKKTEHNTSSGKASRYARRVRSRSSSALNQSMRMARKYEPAARPPKKK